MARERAGLGQRALAQALALSESMVSRIETGKRDVSAFELGLLHETFGWDVRELLGIERPKAKIELAARLRAADGHTAHAGERAATLIEIDALLDDLGIDGAAGGLQLDKPLPVPVDERTAVAEGEAAAARIREDAGITGPLVDLYDFAEGVLGIDVLAQPLDGSCDGIVAVGDRFVLAVIDNSSTVIGARRRFTLAHEIAHAVFGDVRDSVRFEDKGQDPLVELRADRFAGALLMPETDIRAVCGANPSFVELAHAMYTFRVSWAALKKRLAQLGIDVNGRVAAMDPGEIFDRAGRSADLRDLEAHDTDSSLRMPSRINRRIRTAYEDARIGSALVGTAFGVDGEELDRLLATMPRTRKAPEPAL